MREHELKIWPEYFKPVKDGSKNFEYRFDDRGFKVGDILHLREWQKGVYSGQTLKKEISYIFRDPDNPPMTILGLKSDLEKENERLREALGYIARSEDGKVTVMNLECREEEYDLNEYAALTLEGKE